MEQKRLLRYLKKTIQSQLLSCMVSERYLIEKNNTICVGNRIGDDGAKAIAAMLEKNNTITTVRLNCKYVILIDNNNTFFCR